MSAVTDVAFLQMRPMFDDSQLKSEKVAMNLFPPEIDSRIAAFGYAGGRVTLDSDRVNIELSPYTAIGRVVEVHHRGRDSRLPFPTFRTDAQFDGGMSGGPVFDENGKLVGLIFSNLPPFTDDEDHVSYVTLLWPSLGTQLTIPRRHGPDAVPYPALDLARQGYVSVSGWERVTIGDDGDISWHLISPA